VPEGGFHAIPGIPRIAPSDATGAAGITHALTAVNVRYAVYPKAAATPVAVPAQPLAVGSRRALFPGLPRGTVVFDPKVVFDPTPGRFVLAFLAGHGRPFRAGITRSWILVVTVPHATAGDPNTWCRHRFRGIRWPRTADRSPITQGSGSTPSACT
jgi:hypothetical protein